MKVGSYNSNKLTFIEKIRRDKRDNLIIELEMKNKILLNLQKCNVS